MNLVTLLREFGLYPDPAQDSMGISQAYDTGTKIASIYKEFANTPVGIYYVRTSETTFTTNTRYRIEPE